MKKIFVINLGSTSTKLAYFEDDKCIFKETLKHKAEEIKQFNSIWEQESYRKDAIDKFMMEHIVSKYICKRRTYSFDCRYGLY